VNIILPAVLYRREAWSLTLREERRLRVFESRVLRKIFVLKRDEVTREWRILHSEEFYDQYALAYIIRLIESRRMRWAGYMARVGERRDAYRALAVGPEEKRPLGRPRLRWYDNIKTDL
jgi:hypothetical protein